MKLKDKASQAWEWTKERAPGNGLGRVQASTLGIGPIAPEPQAARPDPFAAIQGQLTALRMEVRQFAGASIVMGQQLGEPRGSVVKNRKHRLR